MKVSEKIKILIKYIGDKTDKEIDRIEQETQEKVKELKEKFKKQAESEYSETIEKAEKYATATMKRMVSQAQTEARKLSMGIRTEMLNSTIEYLKKETGALIDSPKYPNIMKTLLQESIATLDEKTAVVKTSRGDKQLIKQLINDLKREQKELTVTISDEYLQERGKIIVESKDGRVSVENSLKGKVEEYREEIASRLFKKLEKAIND